MSEPLAKKVVVFAVDDEPDNLSLICRALRNQYVVRTFDDASDAIEAFKTERCDILVTDFKMPAMSGLDLARAFRRKNNRVPVVVVVSAYADTSEIKVAHESGLLDVVLAKPWSVDDLQYSMRRAVTFFELRKLTHS